MTPDRWTLARDAGDLSLPAGRVAVFHARAEADLAGLSDDILCIQGFKPDADRLTARGFEVVQSADGRAAAALVQIVKSRAATLSAIAEAAAMVGPGGILLIDGQKDEGIEAVLKQMRPVFAIDDVMSKSHGKLIRATVPDPVPAVLEDWIATPTETDAGYLTAPGGFSADGPDRGSELLVALLPPLKGRVADFGAGWGYIAAEVLDEHDAIATLDLIEADFAMLEAAEVNIHDPRARFHWADVTRHQPDTPYDVILSNPPFHTGKRADPALGRAFITAAARNLAPGGKFYMVANRHLPYEDTLKAAFGTGRLLGELEGYKIYEAGKPRRTPVPSKGK